MNDMQAGVIKLGDLVNSVARAPSVEEFKVISLIVYFDQVYLFNLLAYGTPSDNIELAA